MKKCLICEGVFFKNTDFDAHLSEKHNLSYNEYYIEHIVKGRQPCPICGKEKKFDSIVRRYRDTCGDKGCIRSLKASWAKDDTRKKERQVKSEDTKLKNHGDKNYNNRSKYKETCIERYDVENGFQSPEIKEKIEQTHLKNLGVIHPSKSEVIKEKKRNTNLERRGVENPQQSKEVRDKSRLTKLETYGDGDYNNTEKGRETKKEKYGDENHGCFGSDRFKEAMIDIHGVDNILKNKETLDEIKITKFERYGDENYNNRDKYKETCLERYDSPNYGGSLEFKKRKAIDYYNNKILKLDELKPLFDINDYVGVDKKYK